MDSASAFAMFRRDKERRGYNSKQELNEAVGEV